MLEILRCCCAGNLPTIAQLEQLLARELARLPQAKAFNFDQANGFHEIKKRSQLLIVVYPELARFAEKSGIVPDERFLVALWDLWLPLALQLAKVRDQGGTLVQGILGSQGTGKTTLTSILSVILCHLGYSTLAISLDDLYKTYQDRQLLQQQDPRLIWRGPPGTHDIKLGIEVLDRCCQDPCQNQILVPRFDKSAYNGAGDRTDPESVEKPDIVLFDGWFTGVLPVEGTIFDNNLPSPIITQKDRLFAKDINKRLKEYLPLWEKLDRLIVLYPTDYRLSKQWRKEAEQKMKASGKSGMSDAEIEDFVDYFWRSLHPELFITPLVNNPDLVDLVVEINSDRSLGKIYKPGNC